ncbi:MAG: hypothetical protein ACO3UM_14630, partial [Planctomycetota bacterium]
ECRGPLGGGSRRGAGGQAAAADPGPVRHQPRPHPLARRTGRTRTPTRPACAPPATARAGNVIGGGDWSHERLLPDCVRAFANGDPVVLRLPEAVRPWQHVLDPLAGYLLLAEDLALGATSAPQAVNFGPDTEATVGEVARLAAEAWGHGARVEERPHEDVPPETGVLRLDSTLATTALGWRPRWDVRTAVDRTIAWHRAHLAGDEMASVTDAQSHEYVSE